ncbi:MAG: hypothetical protein ABS76_25790 [Pelagibacterium sp. SCN 64-44]|nr:MAG: hypothetical protein ABS76_25790 [Pelagibacterium sp. SCN 64-44]
MNLLTRPLAIGKPVTLWRHSAVAAELFSSPERAMEGEMDPFFFLTREKNFIPHEYPCRTEFGARYRHRRPDERAIAAPDQAWLGFGSPRLDLSGFWFRATRIAARAESVIIAETAGRGVLRLASCGGAILRVNGQEVAFVAEYRRNFEQAVEAEVDFGAGENRIEIFFDDLAERDTRFYVQLDYMSGPRAMQAIPIDCAPEAAGTIETALASAHFERASHDGIDLRLLLAEPLGVAAAAEIMLDGGPMIRRELPPDCTIIEVGPADALPAGFRQVTLRLAVNGFSASRIYGTEISHAGRQGPAPSSLDARIEEALRAVARDMESGTTALLARLAMGDNGAEARALLEPALRQIEECWDCADFALVPLLWCRMRWPELLGEADCARIDRAILSYRYWLDEPGNDVQWYFSENHALLFHTAAHLAGALLPDATFRRSGRSGREQSAIGMKRLEAWFDHFERWEMAEFNSAPYFPIDLKGLAALFALSPNADLRQRAGRAMARLLEIVANSAHQGALTAAQGRSYEHSLRGAATQELSAIARLLWGRGSFGSHFHATSLLALCLRDHGLDLPDLTARACLAGESAEEWRFAQGEGGFARLYHHKSVDHAMGSAVGYRWGEWGYQETLLHLRLGANPQAQIWINHPGEIIHSGHGRPSYWGGSASVPRVQQYRDLAIVLFDGVAPQPDFTHCWFPTPDFDAAGIEGDGAWAASGAGLAFIRGSSAFEQVLDGPTANHELRLAGRKSWWLVRLGSAALHGDPAQFRARFAPLEPRDDGGRIVVDDPDYGRIEFFPDGTVLGEGRRIAPEDFTVLGTRDTLPRGPIQKRRVLQEAYSGRPS